MTAEQFSERRPEKAAAPIIEFRNAGYSLPDEVLTFD